MFRLADQSATLKMYLLPHARLYFQCSALLRVGLFNGQVFFSGFVSVFSKFWKTLESLCEGTPPDMQGNGASEHFTGRRNSLVVSPKHKLSLTFKNLFS